MDQSRINYDLVDKLITHINEKYEEGGVLVFLPGMQDITTLMELLLMNPTLKKAKVLPLHSALSTGTVKFDAYVFASEIKQRKKTLPKVWSSTAISIIWY
jgi:HrpA-like RNA helicase